MDNTQQQINLLAVAMQCNIPTIIVSDPGEAKSALIKAIFEELGWPHKIILGSIMDPTDLGGWPVDDGTSIVRRPPQWAKEFAQEAIGDGFGGIFLEEFNLAPKAVQSAMMRVIHEAVVGDTQLGRNVCRVAAINPIATSASGFSLDPPLANRFFWVDWELTTQFWTEGLISGFPAPSVPRLDPSWVNLIPATRAAIAGYIMSHRSAMKSIPDNEVAASGPFPTARSWTAAMTLLAAADSLGWDEAYKLLLLKGTVGEGAAIAYLTYRRAFDLPNPKDMMADPHKVKWPVRGDQMYAALTSLASYVLELGTKEAWLRSWDVMEVAAKKHKDVVAPIAQMLAKKIPEGITTLPESMDALYGTLLANRMIPSPNRATAKK